MADAMRDYLEERERTLETRMEQMQARHEKLYQLLLEAQSAIRDAHEAAVLKGVNVHWDVLEPRLRRLHDKLTAELALQ